MEGFPFVWDDPFVDCVSNLVADVVVWEDPLVAVVVFVSRRVLPPPLALRVITRGAPRKCRAGEAGAGRRQRRG